MSRETKVMVGILVVVVAALVGLFLVFNKANTPSVASGDSLVRSNSHKLDSGPVTVVEFGDYQCPACGAAYPDTKKLQAQYAGKITFVFRNYPLTQHKNALAAAEAAEAAGDQGKFWEMHDKLYENQKEWQDLANPLDKFGEYAKALGLDVDKFKAAVSSNQFADIIQADQNDGNSLQISGTPTFYVNGKVQPDFQYNTLDGAIKAEIK